MRTGSFPSGGKAGVHSLNDISVLDEQYKGQKSQKTRKNHAVRQTTSS